MSRQRTIVVLAAVYYAAQMALLVYWHSLAVPEFRLLDALITLGIAAVMGFIDWWSARYLLQALSRTEQVYADDVSQQLEQSLENYRTLAEREEQRSAEIGREVEAELAQARKSLAEGRTDDVAMHLQQGLDIATSLRKPPCDNVAVAAILEAKTRECEEAGVELSTQVALPAELGLPDIEVASLLFNLIDNALHECAALRAQDAVAKPVITLHARTQAGQLFVQASNPCRPGIQAPGSRTEKRDTEALHGWGTDIVRTIAHNHGGIAEFTFENEVFIATVMIPLT